MHLGVNLPLILNKYMLPEILHRFSSTYDCLSDMNSITLVMFENKCPLNKFDFLILFVIMNTITNKINSNKVNIYHCILQVQYSSWNLRSVASTPFTCCKAMIVTKAFN